MDQIEDIPVIGEDDLEDNVTIEIGKNPKYLIKQAILSALLPILLTSEYAISSFSRHSHSAFTFAGEPLPIIFELSVHYIAMGLLVLLSLGVILHRKLSKEYVRYMTINRKFQELSIRFVSFTNTAIYQVLNFSDIKEITLDTDFGQKGDMHFWSLLKLRIILNNGYVITSEISSWEGFLSIYKNLKGIVPIRFSQDYGVDGADLQEIVYNYELTGQTPGLYKPKTKLMYPLVSVPLIVSLIYALVLELILMRF